MAQVRRDTHVTLQKYPILSELRNSKLLKGGICLSVALVAFGVAMIASAHFAAMLHLSHPQDAAGLGSALAITVGGVIGGVTLIEARTRAERKNTPEKDIELQETTDTNGVLTLPAVMIQSGNATTIQQDLSF